MSQLTNPLSKPVSTAGSADELALLKLVAYHGYNHPDYGQALNRLTSAYSNTLTPEDWEAAGFGYWETQNYGQAGDAYAKAPYTPVNLYRAARGKEIKGKRLEAIAAYQKLNQTFPVAPETAAGLLNLADLLPYTAAMAILGSGGDSFP